jgi:hypothetical protein
MPAGITRPTTCTCRDDLTRWCWPCLDSGWLGSLIQPAIPICEAKAFAATYQPTELAVALPAGFTRPADCTCQGSSNWCKPCVTSGYYANVVARLRPSDLPTLPVHVQYAANTMFARTAADTEANRATLAAELFPARIATLNAQLAAMTRERDAALLVRDAAVQTSHQCMDALVAERRAQAAVNRARAAGFTDVSDRKAANGWHAPPYIAPTAFQDPDDPAPPDTRPTMPAAALRQPRATGWQAMR